MFLAYQPNALLSRGHLLLQQEIYRNQKRNHRQRAQAQLPPRSLPFQGAPNFHDSPLLFRSHPVRLFPGLVSVIPNIALLAPIWDHRKPSPHPVFQTLSVRPMCVGFTALRTNHRSSPFQNSHHFRGSALCHRSAVTYCPRIIRAGFSTNSILAISSPYLDAITANASSSFGCLWTGSCASLANTCTWPLASSAVAVASALFPNPPSTESAVTCTKHPCSTHPSSFFISFCRIGFRSGCVTIGTRSIPSSRSRTLSIDPEMCRSEHSTKTYLPPQIANFRGFSIASEILSKLRCRSHPR